MNEPAITPEQWQKSVDHRLDYDRDRMDRLRETSHNLAMKDGQIEARIDRLASRLDVQLEALRSDLRVCLIAVALAATAALCAITLAVTL